MKDNLDEVCKGFQHLICSLLFQTRENHVNYGTSSSQDAKTVQARHYENRSNATISSKRIETNVSPNGNKTAALSHLTSELESTASGHHHSTAQHRLQPHAIGAVGAAGAVTSYQQYHQQNATPQVENDHDQYP